VVSVEAIKKQSELALNPIVLVMPKTAHMGMFENEILVTEAFQEFLRYECM
jgi:hypothetical protein